MRQIGLISDTHGYVDDRVFDLFQDCDEIWHAGDIGTVEIADRFEAFKPFKAVYGNIDGHLLRARYPLNLRFHCEDVEVWMTHIGGYPGRYNKRVREAIRENPPKLFITGHSHILKVMPDRKLDLLHMNPGAAGNHGFHQVKTILRFFIDGDQILDLEAIELGKRRSLS
ncbi:MAG: metallophosphoesterase family protein [Bacteroidota bacterium]